MRRLLDEWAQVIHGSALSSVGIQHISVPALHPTVPLYWMQASLSPEKLVPRTFSWHHEPGSTEVKVMGAMTKAVRATKVQRDPEPLSSMHLIAPLPYDYAALEPVIDARTMMLHHDRHHESYVSKLNEAVDDYPDLQRRSALWLLLNPGKVPANIRTVVRHNVGGHANHSLFWNAMAPAGRGSPAPAGALAAAIDRDFGSFDKFKRRFVKAGEKLFASGWVWLVKSSSNGGKLLIRTTNGHGNPLVNGHFPILLNDVWEHAYYLNYQNKRSEYLRAWWSIVNWEEAARRFERSSVIAAEQDWEDEGGTVSSISG